MKNLEFTLFMRILVNDKSHFIGNKVKSTRKFETSFIYHNIVLSSLHSKQKLLKRDLYEYDLKFFQECK